MRIIMCWAAHLQLAVLAFMPALLWLPNRKQALLRGCPVDLLTATSVRSSTMQ